MPDQNPYFQESELPPDELGEAEIKLLRKVINQDVSQRWAAQLAQQGIRREHPPRRNISWIWYAAAASAALLIIGFYWWQTRQTGLSEVLASARMQPYPFETATRGNDQGPHNYAWEEAVRAYQAGQFEAARTAVKQIPPESITPEQRLLLGLTYLHQTPPDYNQAWEILQNIPEPNQNFPEWYLFAAIAAAGREDWPQTKLLCQKALQQPALRGKYRETALKLLAVGKL